MARGVLMIWVAALGLAGCVEAPVLVVETPLLVFNTYPANGATLDRADLGEVAITFSADVGPAEAVVDHVVLRGADGVLPLLRDDGANVGYDADTFTLRVALDAQAQDALAAGTYDLTVTRGLEAVDGRRLPTDYVVRFTVVAR